MLEDNDLHMMVGEIRSDVKKLLKSDIDYGKRLATVEHRQWWMAGVGACVAFFAARMGFH